MASGGWQLQAELAANVVVLAAMLISVLRFLWSALQEDEHRGSRLLAALTSLITLTSAGLIYSAEFTRIADSAISHWGTPGFHRQAVNAALSVQHLFDSADRTITFSSTPVGSHPALWAGIFLMTTYALRFLIYVAARRRRLSDANAIGSVVWSHITAFGMVIGFALIAAHWPPLIVALAALAALLLLATVLTGIFADFSALIAGYVKFLAGALIALLQEVANAAVWFAGEVKAAFKRAAAWYEAHISARIRAHADRMTERSRRLRQAASRHLDNQNRRQRQRFQRSDGDAKTGDL